ncbi:MAG: DUF2283 domain-containing protein [Candidatus Pacebacteria bacterium]|nr:DUF2283 domain-containing protein [Candidatus Paceibacterota bacterium]
MKINYDKEIDVKYICLKKAKVVNTKEEKDWLLFDYDKNGEVIGIEILDAKKHPISVFAVGEKFINLGIVKTIKQPKSKIGSEYTDYITDLMKVPAFT